LFAAYEEEVAEDCEAIDKGTCKSWESDGSACPCYAAGDCTYTAAEEPACHESGQDKSVACAATPAGFAPDPTVRWMCEYDAAAGFAPTGCTYAPAVKESCAAADLAACADWMSDGSSAACTGAGKCAYTAEVQLAHECVPCPSGTEHFPLAIDVACAANTRLELVTDRLPWADAEADCVARGGHLASIHSENENDIMFEIAGNGAW
jgi:hypothetical protein